jgi:periplasmic copper chaperone A
MRGTRSKIDRRGRRGSLLVATATGVLLVAWTSVAGAHVTVTPASATKGGFQILSFSVPNEKDDANTTALEVEFPLNNPIPFASVKPMPGWTITVENGELAKPVTSHGDTITEAVSKVTWTATAGGLEPGQFDLFTISAGPLPTKPNKLVFKALQTYSDGEIVRWIEPTVKGTPEPEFPAPTLRLTKASSVDGH